VSKPARAWVVGQFENHRAVTTGAASHRSPRRRRRLGATLRTIDHGRFDTMDRGEERKAAEVVTAPPDRKLTRHPRMGKTKPVAGPMRFALGRLGMLGPVVAGIGAGV
jgi:hypothetical protein